MACGGHKIVIHRTACQINGIVQGCDRADAGGQILPDLLSGLLGKGRHGQPVPGADIHCKGTVTPAAGDNADPPFNGPGVAAQGLTKGDQYEVQVSKTSEDGRRLQPDVIVKLPEQKIPLKMQLNISITVVK